jgi:hypothetical protein
MPIIYIIFQRFSSFSAALGVGASLGSPSSISITIRSLFLEEDSELTLGEMKLMVLIVRDAVRSSHLERLHKETVVAVADERQGIIEGSLGVVRIAV